MHLPVKRGAFWQRPPWKKLIQLKKLAIMSFFAGLLAEQTGRADLSPIGGAEASLAKLASVIHTRAIGYLTAIIAIEIKIVLDEK